MTSESSLIVLLLLVSLFAAILIVTEPVLASPFTGGAGLAAPNYVGIFGGNPALGLLRKESIIEAGPVYRLNKVGARYPGFDPIERDHQGLDYIGTLRSIHMSGKRGRYSFGISPIPPLTVPKNLTRVREVPLVLLGQPNMVDVDARVNLDGGLGLGGAYAFSDRFAMGANVNFLSISGRANLMETQSGRPLATAEFEVVDFQASFGVFWQVHRRFALGGVTRLVQGGGLRLKKIKTAAADIDVKGPQPASRYLPSAAVGLSWLITHRMVWLLDLEYSRANTTQEELSLVDLAPKVKETHDTLGVRTGVVFKLQHDIEFMSGGSYMPASIGEGGLGKGSQAGYGSIDFVPVILGFADLVPSTAMAAGLRFHLDAKYERSTSKDKKTPIKTRLSYYRWSYASGVIYQTAQLGIGPDGELPAAYYQKSFRMPLIITYRY